MIQYEQEGASAWYDANRKYCERVTDILSAYNSPVEGYCNAFGYQVNGVFTRDALQYEVRFEKHQSTQNGVVMPVNGNDCAALKLKVRGVRGGVRWVLKKAGLLRWMMPKKLKEKVPAPYYLGGTTRYVKKNIDPLLNLISEHGVIHAKRTPLGFDCEIVNKPVHFTQLVSTVDQLLRDTGVAR